MNVNPYETAPYQDVYAHDKCDKYDKDDKYDKYDKYDKDDKHDKHDKCDKCDNDAVQFVDISVPVEICPDVKLGRIETECCGDPFIQCECEPCGSNLSIIVTQSVKIRIPVKFDVKTIEGNGFIKCCEGCCDK